MRSLLRPKENERDDKDMIEDDDRDRDRGRDEDKVSLANWQPSARLCNLFTLQGGFAMRDRVGQIDKAK